MPKQIEIWIEDGEICFDWWTPESGDLICDFCGRCAGWRTDEKPVDCVAGNPYCG